MAAGFPSLTGSSKRRIGFWARAGVATAGAAAIVGGAFIAGGTGRPVASRPSPQSAPKAPHAKLASAPPNDMYWMDAADGGIFTEPLGVTPFYGSEGYHHLNQPVVGMAAAPNGQGYWLVARDGGVFTEGNIGFHGSAAGRATSPIVGMAVTPDGGGYWIVGSDGHVYNFGDAPDFGSEYPKHLNQPVVGMAATPDGGGYWLVAADGGIFTHGDAPYLGGEGWHHLNQPVVGMAARPDGKGYWLAAADGGVFTEGPIPFYGSEGYHHLNQPVVGIAASPLGHGYWMVASDGGIFTEGPDAGFGGSEGYHQLNQPVVGMAAVPVLIPSSVSLSPTANTLVADGASTSTITAVVRDAGGNPIPGRTVDFSVITGGCGSVSPSQGVTDLNGAVATTYTASNQTGNCSIRAADANSSAANTVVIAQSVGAPMHITASPSTASSPTTDQGAAGIPVTFTVTDAMGHPVPGATVDLSTTLFHGSVPPSTTADSSGVAHTAVTDTWAQDPNNPDTGVVTGTIHGTGVHASTGTMTIVPGAFAQLAQPSVSAQTAGAAYPVAVSAEDAYGNPVNPSTSELTPSGTALATAPDTTHQGSATWDPAGFSGGTAILHVTSYKAGSVVLTITDTNPSITTTTQPYPVAATAATGITATTPASATSDNADDATANGVTVTFTPTDQYLNPVPGTTVDMTVAPVSSHATLSAASPVSDSSGKATTKLHDSIAEASTVTGTVHGTSIHASSPAITITAGALHTLAFSGTTTPGSAIPALTAGSPTTVYLNATDTYGNPVDSTPPSSITIGGTALATQGGHAGTASVGSFSGGQAPVTLTTYKAGTGRTLNATNGSTVTSPDATLNVVPGALASITETSPSLVATNISANSLFFQDPNGSQTATVTLSGADAYGNAATNNTDALTVTLSADAPCPNGVSTTTCSSALNPDGGTVTSGSTPGSPDSTAIATLSGGSATFTYTTPSTLATGSGNGLITVTDSHTTGVSFSPATIPVTVTKIHSVNFSSQPSYTADAGSTGITLNAIAFDGTNAATDGAALLFTVSGFNATVTPTPVIAKTLGPNGAQTTFHATVANETGSLTALLYGAPTSVATLQQQTQTITITNGAFSQLIVGNVGAQVAGVQYALSVAAADAEGNVFQPSAVTLSYDSANSTALSAAPDGTLAASTITQFDSMGHATATVTSYHAQSGATLAFKAGTVSKSVTFDIATSPTFGAPVITYQTPFTSGTSWKAGTGNSGLAMSVKAWDQYENLIGGAQVQLTTSLTGATVDTSASPSKGTSVAFPVTVTTNAASSGATASFTVYDTQAQTGKTVSGQTLTGGPIGTSSPAFSIVPDALASITLATPGTQNVNSSYNVGATAFDAYSNPIPGQSFATGWTASGQAVAASPNGSHTGSVAWPSSTTTDSNGKINLPVTSFLAGQVTLTISGTVSATSGTYTVQPGTASEIYVTSSDSKYTSSTATLTLNTNNERVLFTAVVADTYGNLATTHLTDQISVVLTGNATADGGSLAPTDGGPATSNDSNNTATTPLLLNLVGGASSFYYDGPAIYVNSGSGTINWTDTPLGSSVQDPASGILVKGPLP